MCQTARFVFTVVSRGQHIDLLKGTKKTKNTKNSGKLAQPRPRQVNHAPQIKGARDAAPSRVKARSTTQANV